MPILNKISNDFTNTGLCGKTDAKPKFVYSSIILPLAIPPESEGSGVQLNNLEKRGVFP
jgi:hypothetical protein